MKPAPPSEPAPPAGGATRPPRLPLDPRSASLLKRFTAEWVAPRWRQILVSFVLMALLAAATGAYPAIIKLSFDTLTKGDTSVLGYVLAGIVAITLIRSVLLYLQTIASNRLVMRMTTDIQREAFAHLIHADLDRLGREAPGRLMSRLTNDIGFINGAAMAALNTAVRDTLSIIALVISMIYLDPMLSLVVLVVYPIAALPVAAISSKLRRVATRMQSELGGMTALLSETLSGVRLVKTFRLEDYAVDRVSRSFEQVFELKMKAIRNRGRLDPMLEALGGIAVAGVIAFAYWRITTGISTVGDFMGFITALLMAAQPMRALGNLSGKIQEGLAAVESVYGILDETPRIAQAPDARPLSVGSGTIAFEGVGFTYKAGGDIPAVRDFSIVVPGGRTVALVGRSGAGKSTVINLVPRLYDVTAGRILIDGQDIRSVTLASLRDAIAIVSQDVTLFDVSIRANIALGRLGATEDEIVVAAKAAAAHDFIMAQPNGYATEIGDRGLKLSGGQRQRIALARAILRDAPILLLDEATSALDSDSERLVQDALARFTRDRTTLVVAHRLSTVMGADLICVMEAGAIVETGTHVELMGRNGDYARLVRAQMLTGPEPSAAHDGRARAPAP